ncbi:hypothetical protein SDC9_107875 [bioreactor metagenome]|uniref:Uncharacterized protein n=1 Tax=bioreactor metagenome TaxID=1076179 RepID=A0A645B8R2_9ZZZZ
MSATQIRHQYNLVSDTDGFTGTAYLLHYGTELMTQDSWIGLHRIATTIGMEVRAAHTDSNQTQSRPALLKNRQLNLLIFQIKGFV